MATRRCFRALIQTTPFLFRTNQSSLRSLTLPSFPHTNASPNVFLTPASLFAQGTHPRYYSSDKQDHNTDEEDDDSEDYEQDYDDEDEDDDDDDDDVPVSSGRKNVYTAEEKEAEAADIGYRVVGPLTKDDDVFKPYEPVFAVVQIGSHQFKVSNGDSVFTERLKFCEVNDKLILNKVLLLGSASQTIVGRPIVPDAAVHAVVEEHALDAKVIIFKKKRRKNYRRTKGHRQELTKLRITDIQGIEKPQNVLSEKPSKPAKKEDEKVAVTA